jgi:DNA-binding MarR family transcriptional regulator
VRAWSLVMISSTSSGHIRRSPHPHPLAAVTPRTLDCVDRLLELALAVKAVHRELERWTNEALRPLGVTGAQADTLVVISQAEPVSLKELGDLLIAEGGHPSRLVDRLVEAGLVARRAAEDDRRRIVLTLTVRGRRLVGRVVKARPAPIRFAAGHVGAVFHSVRPLWTISVPRTR